MSRIKKWLGIDKAILFTLFNRGWSVAAGLVTIFMVTHYLSPEFQGYYYTFNSLIALQIFVELGLTYVVIQFSSHEMVQLKWSENGIVFGNVANKRRLQSLIYFTIAWFAAAAILMIGVLLPIGLYFFNSTTSTTSTASIYKIGWPWMVLVVFSAINLFVVAAGAVLEGCGKITDIAVMRFWQTFISAGTAWIVLWQGGGLFALVANSGVMALIGIMWLSYKYRKFFIDILAGLKDHPGIGWRSEIWPFQWRIALSWMSGYLIFQLFNPLLFATHGPVAAGKMGMSLQIITAMNAAAMAWISTKVPMYGNLVAMGKEKELDDLAKRGFIQSFFFLLVGIIVVGIIFYYLSLSQASFSERILPLPLLAILALVCLANHVAFAQAAYLRAHKEDPFVSISIMTGIVTAALAFLLVPSMGARGAVWAYAIAVFGIGLQGGTFIYVRKRKKWIVN